MISNEQHTTDQDNYQVKLKLFEGPLDLLLHLIRKNEVDIFDIPISMITDQYLQYIDMMKALNINVAGDFLVMAATLTHIKSKMLLPGHDDEEEEDPRMEIARPLIEYLRLKEVAGDLSEREMLGRDVFARSVTSDIKSHLNAQEPVFQVNLFHLMDAFQRLIDEYHPGEALQYQAQEWSIKDKTSLIMDRLKEGPVFFRELFHQSWTMTEFIITFLALLELAHMRLIKITQTDIEKDIRLEGRFEEEQDPDHV